MTHDDPSAFYTGLVADLYAPLRGAGRPDPAPYLAAVRRHGEPALELGCGDGDPLLDLLQAGLDVEGLDSSADMLDRCRRNAAARGLSPTLHLATLQSMDLPRQYRCIYLAGPTFNLLPDDDTALAALHAIRRHLTPDGTAVVPLFVPPPTPPEQLGLRRSQQLDDGSTIAVSAVHESIDADARTVTTVLRYERTGADGTRETLDRPWLRHWYTQHGFLALATAAGLAGSLRRVTGGPVRPDDEDYVALLRPA